MKLCYPRVYEKRGANVTDAYGKERQYHLTEVIGRKRVESITNGPGGVGSPGVFPYSDSNAVSWVYDDQMWPIEVGYASETNTVTQYLDYDLRGNPGVVKVVFGTPEERVIRYTYHPEMNVPLTRTEASVMGVGNKETIWDYDDDGDAVANENPTGLLYRIIEKGFTRNGSGDTVPYEYVTAFTYNSKGQVLAIDGPKADSGDTTSFTYDLATGDLLSITRPIIGATDFTNHDAAGEVGTVTDVNDRSEGFTYDGRGRVRVITHHADSSTVSVLYDTAGLPESQTDEDGVHGESVLFFLFITVWFRGRQEIEITGL